MRVIKTYKLRFFNGETGELCQLEGGSFACPTCGEPGLLRDNALESAQGVDRRGSLAPAARFAACEVAGRRPDRPFACGGRLRERAFGFWGQKAGVNPTDRRKNGSKHHYAVDAGGVPLATTLTGANRHDVTQFIPLIDAIPPIAGKCGAPLCKAGRVYKILQEAV